MSTSSWTLMPFLYPCIHQHRTARLVSRTTKQILHPRYQVQKLHTSSPHSSQLSQTEASIERLDHLNPSADSYSLTPFADRCNISLHAGSGGHGCISFLREKYVPDGPANGGDGGTGGSIYIQAIKGETSLHKLARRGILKAGRGRNGQGKNQGGERGKDVLVQVPVGTIVREVWRYDPIEEENLDQRRSKAKGADADFSDYDAQADQRGKWRRDKWLLYPGALPSSFVDVEFPALPRARRSNLSMSQPSSPIRLDLDQPMDKPALLAAGAVGGLGNPHFVTKSIPRPKFATKGEEGMKLEIQLELKLLADVGLVGLPNAGKSTLLRALSNSRARVGNWAFTTLQPNIGTVVLDSYKGRPRFTSSGRGEPRTNFTIADIPGLIEDAHMDKGLGLGFLRHIERAGTLAFVVDLSAGDAVAALQGLWREVGQYELLRDRELHAETERRTQEEHKTVEYDAFGRRDSPVLQPKEVQDDQSLLLDPEQNRELPPLRMPPISSKPWLVVATKADLPETRDNFTALRTYLHAVQAGEAVHPCGKKNAWAKKVNAIPISAMRDEGVDTVVSAIVDLLDD